MEKALVDLDRRTIEGLGRGTAVLACMMGLGYGSMRVAQMPSVPGGLRAVGSELRGGLAAAHLLRGESDEAQMVLPAPKPPVAVAGVATGHKNKNRLLHGIASWYGEVWEGRLTASGEVFRQSALTACHASLPFGTLVRVINLRNHRSVVVRINDRGLEGTGRVIDLSSAAAEQIGMLEEGLAPVRLEVLGRAARG